MYPAGGEVRDRDVAVHLREDVGVIMAMMGTDICGNADERLEKIKHTVNG